jgi:hypothetical protein
MKNQVHPLSDEINRGYEIKKELKKLEDESSDIKKKLRKAATEEPGAVKGSGEAVILQGSKHKARVNLSEDSFSLKDGTSSIDIRRIKAVLDAGIGTINEGVKLKEGVTLRKVKEVLGEQYAELFEDDIQAKFDAISLTKWFQQRRKMASEDPSIDFVERHLDRKSNTERVTFLK